MYLEKLIKKYGLSQTNFNPFYKEKSETTSKNSRIQEEDLGLNASVTPKMIQTAESIQEEEQFRAGRIERTTFDQDV